MYNKEKLVIGVGHVLRGGPRGQLPGAPHYYVGQDPEGSQACGSAGLEQPTNLSWCINQERRNDRVTIPPVDAVFGRIRCVQGCAG